MVGNAAAKSCRSSTGFSTWGPPEAASAPEKWPVDPPEMASTVRNSQWIRQQRPALASRAATIGKTRGAQQTAADRGPVRNGQHR